LKDPVTIINKIEISSSEIMLRSDGIIHFYIKTNVNLTGNDAKEMVDAAGKVGNNKKYPVLISAGKYALAEKEAREFAASEEGNKYTIAGAIVVKSLAQKLLGNAYLKVNKPVTPTALFDNEENAIKWLRTYL
jgi:hypothetical protein